MRLRSILTSVAAIAGALCIATGSATASSGGGCGTYNGPIKGCVSESGVYILGDAYVNGTSGPSVTISIYDYTQGRTVVSGTFGGGQGHKGPVKVVGIRGHAYQTWATTNGKQSRSPTLIG